ncbi:hypothetical protein EAG_12703 [Camponotus floridanus]|uniref:Uncharacterized protein n=1 Tax=Camponotus floridanus TaxID=104421 RepID=E2AXZ6_CAMFO|nr:hypothetical protein EAG_12703 [Camponotus floridanus]
MGVSPLSDPLTTVGVEAPALTANVSHIPGLQPVLRRSRPVLSGRWTARKSVSLTTGSCISCTPPASATRIYCRGAGRSCPTRTCLGVDESRTVSSVLTVSAKVVEKKTLSACAAYPKIDVDNPCKNEIREQIVLRKNFAERI